MLAGFAAQGVRLAGLDGVGTEAAQLFTTAYGNLSLRRG